MNPIKEKYQNNRKELVGDICFWMALSIELVSVILDKSKYIIQGEFYLFLFTCFLFGVKIICSHFSMKEWVILFILGVLGILSYFFSGRTEFFRGVVLMGAASRVSLQQVMKYSFAVTLSGSMLIIILAAFGIGYPFAETGLYRGGGIEETRYSFGMGHPNAFHCMFLMLLLLWIYLYYKQSKWYQYLIWEIANVLFYRMTDSNYGFLMFTMTILLAVVTKYLPRIFHRMWLYLLGIVSLFLSVLLSCAMAKYGVGLSPVFRMIDDKLLNGRLQLTYWYGEISTWSIFSSRSNTEFFDMGIARLFYWYGWIPATICILIVIWMIITCMEKKEIEVFLIIFVLNLYTLFEAHIVSTYIGRNYLILFAGTYFLSSLTQRKIK